MGRSREPRGKPARRASPVPGCYPVSYGEAELVRDADRQNAWLLNVGGIPQSHVDLEDPTYLGFDYVQQIADAVDCVKEPGCALDALHVGGGGCTLARYVAATRPGSRQTVFELDEGIVALGREQLALRRVPQLRVRVGDGRTGLARRHDDSADLVVLDAFEGPAFPGELATAEFVREVARVLRPSGAYILNVADGHGLAFAKRVTATVRSVVGDTVVLAEPGVLRGRHFGNVIVVASPAPLPVAALTRRSAGSAFPARCLDGDELDRFCGRSAVLTDADEVRVPVPPSAFR